MTDGPHVEPTHVLAFFQRMAVERTAGAPIGWRDVLDYWADHSAAVARTTGGSASSWRPKRGCRSSTRPRRCRSREMTPTACWRAASSCIGGAGLVSAVAAANGVDLAFWWQPTLYSRDPAEGEEFLLERAAHRHPACTRSWRMFPRRCRPRCLISVTPWTTSGPCLLGHGPHQRGGVRAASPRSPSHVRSQPRDAAVTPAVREALRNHDLDHRTGAGEEGDRMDRRRPGSRGHGRRSERRRRVAGALRGSRWGGHPGACNINTI